LSITGNWERRCLSRRDFLAASGMGAAALALGAQGLWLPRSGLAQTSSDPFKLGVASGDPLPNSVVLWTRLTPGDPLNGGGTPSSTDVLWEVARDANFTTLVRSGTAKAESQFAYSVHVDAGVEGTGDQLSSGTHYYYRFKNGSYTSPTGRTKTVPAANASPASMKFALASCQHWESGYYTAYGHMATQDLDLIVHVGDYIYEGAPSGGNVLRKHSAVVDSSWGCNTLADYRNRHAQYKTDKHLRAAHAAHPWVVVWDDHEVENDYVGTNSWYRQSDFANRRAAAYQAYYEHMPLRRESLTLNGSQQVTNIRLYRPISYGQLAQFSVLDTRQFRSYWACANQGSLIEDNCSERTQDPIIKSRKPYRRHASLGGETMGLYSEPSPWLKDSQENWLKERLASSSSRWNIMAQQVIMFKYDHNDWSGDYYSEAWDSYSATRDRILKHIVDRKVPNPVVLSGDMHSGWASNLESNFYDTSTSDVIGAEFTTTSITSGLSSGWDTTYKNALSANRHVKHYEGRQGGYLLCTLDNTRWKTEYIVAASLKDDNNTNATVSKTLYLNAKDSGSSGVLST
jgi:alkaline phosphatase D